MNSSPLVSVLLTVYNRPTVLNTIKSILAQTYSNFELIIVDNASTDNTVKLIQDIDDPRIKLYINEENKGQTFSLNRGLSLSNGKYICRIDADDIALPQRLEKQVAFLENNPDYVLCGSWVQFINDSDELSYVVKMPTTSEGMFFMQTFTCAMFHPASMYRNDVIKEQAIQYAPNYKMAEDYWLWFILMKYGKAKNLGETLLYYRRGNNNDSTTHKETMFRESYEVRQLVCSYYFKDKVLKKHLAEINREMKDRKSIFTIFRIIVFLTSYFRKNISKHNEDYSIIKLHLYMKIYGACFAHNNTWFSRKVVSMYQRKRSQVIK